MGCFSIQHGRRRRIRVSAASSSSSPARPSSKILQEASSIGAFSSPCLAGSSHPPWSSSSSNTTYCTRSKNPDHTTPQVTTPSIRARASLHNASSNLVKPQNGRSPATSSFRKAAKQLNQRAAGAYGHNADGRSIISYSPILLACTGQDGSALNHDHLFPLPLPPAKAVSRTEVPEDLSPQYTPSSSSLSSPLMLPSSCSVSGFPHDFKRYNNPLSSFPTTADSKSEARAALPLPLPPPANLDSGSSLREFSYDELAGACLNFAPEFLIRDGGLGPVYRAIVRPNSENEGAMEGAVTRLLRGHVHSFKKWRADVGSLARLCHPHVCKVLGYSREDSVTSSDKMSPVLQRERLLVYEHTCNGSLDSLLYCRRGKAPLDWAARLRIAQGAAQGLAYLHDRSRGQVIYNCFKTSNIQVDENFNAKLSDYGFAATSRMIDQQASCSPAARNRLTDDEAYAAPEMRISDKLVAIKSNVWSFGVVLLELLTGRQHMDEFFPEEERNLLLWCRPYLSDPKRLYLVMDPELKGRYSTQTAKKVADWALRCLAEEPMARPSMRDVAMALSLLVPPCIAAMKSQAEKKFVGYMFDLLPPSNNGYSNTTRAANYNQRKVSKSYNLASFLASPARTFPSRRPFLQEGYNQCRSPAQYISDGRRMFRGSLSGEIMRESSLSLGSSFLSGELVVHHRGQASIYK